MKNFSLLFVLFCAIHLCGCTSDEPKPRPAADETAQTPPEPEPAPDGLYRVLATANGLMAQVQSSGRQIAYNHRFLDGDSAKEPASVWIDTTDYVPLELAAAPDSVRQPDERIHLLLSLSDKAAAKLAEFTEQHLDEQVAIVVGGEVVTMHKVREKIDGGKLQITRCTDNACEYLYMELRDNMAKKKEKEEDDGLEHMIPPLPM